MSSIKIAVSCVLALLAGIVLSCANPQSDPIAPQSTAASPPTVMAQSGAQENRYLWAYYQIKYDPVGNSFELMPFRDTATHWNVLKFLEQGACTDCVKVKGVTPGPSGTKLFDVEITHPFPSPNLTGFDVRGIALFHGTQIFPVAGLTVPDRNQGDGELVNPDGYTELYNSGTAGSGPGGLQGYLKGKFASPTVPNASLNGYKRHISGGVANTRNAFYASDKIIATYELDMPDTQFIFGYAVDASWAPPTVKPVTDPMTDFPPEANCPEPWKVDVIDFPVGFGLTDQGGSATIIIDVFDWQGKDSHLAPTVECPELFDGVATAAFVQDFADHTQWEATVTNTKLASVGSYRCLVKVVDKDNLTAPSWLSLIAYQLHTVTIIEGGWARTWGDTIVEIGQDVALDSSGNVYVTGYFSSASVDFDPGTPVDIHSSNGAADIYLSKFDSSGNFVWALTWGGSGFDAGYGLAVDDTGHVYVTGQFEGTDVDFDPGIPVDLHSSNGISDIFLCKFNSSGTFAWARTWGGSEIEWGYKVVVEGSANVYVTGTFQGISVDFNPDSVGVDPQSSNGWGDVFLSKFDSYGTFAWACTWGGSVDDDYGYSVAVDESGNAYVSGSFEGLVDFDPGPSIDLRPSEGSQDVFLSKIDSSGTYVWVNTWGGSEGQDDGRDVDVDGSGNAYVIGHYAGISVDFDPGIPIEPHSSNGLSDIFLSKFDPSGTFLWARTWGGTEWDSGSGVDVDGSGNAHVTGDFQGTSVDFNPDPIADDLHSSNGEFDIFLSKFDSSGTFSWARTWGGIDSDTGNSVAVDESGYSYVAGYYWGASVDFNPDSVGVDLHSSIGDRDAFLSKFNPDGIW